MTNAAALACDMFVRVPESFINQMMVIVKMVSQSTNKLSRIYVGSIENINGLIIMTQIAF